MKVIGFTGSRADYYLQRPLFKRLNVDSDISFGLVVGGNIPSELSGQTLIDIANDNFYIIESIELPPNAITSTHSYQIALFCLAFEPIIKSFCPDVAIVYADRYETFAFALTAFHNDIIVFHLEAGDITQGGTYDDSLRHCISKMSHIQASSTTNGLKVLHSLGEESWRSICIGLLSYESMLDCNLLDAYQVHDNLCLTKEYPLIIVTMHSIPSSLEDSLNDNANLLEALILVSNSIFIDIIITSPNQDFGGHLLSQQIEDYLPRIRSCQYIESLGGFNYHSLISLATDKVVIICGNSSSVIKEAPYFGAHGLNIGRRQSGREAASTQFNVSGTCADIVDAILLLSNTPCAVGYNPYLSELPSLKAVSFLKNILLTKSNSQILLKLWSHNLP